MKPMTPSAATSLARKGYGISALDSFSAVSLSKKTARRSEEAEVAFKQATEFIAAQAEENHAMTLAEIEKGVVT